MYEYLKFNLALINPITGAVKAPSHFFASGKLNYELELMPHYHTEMQYKFFEKLRESGHLVTAEVEYGPNTIFAPNEITISEVEGTKDWKPDPFSAGALEKIGMERFPEARGDLSGKIDIVAKPKDDYVVDGYEVKPELPSLKEGERMIQQLRSMIDSRVLDRVWIVVPSWLASEIEKLIASDDSLKHVGIIAYFDGRRFETVKEAE